MTTRLAILLAKGQLLARRHLDLPLDQIDAGNHFSDWVLHLDTRVDLGEVETLFAIDQKLECSGSSVFQRLRRADRRFVQPVAQFTRNIRRGRFLD